MIALEVTDRDVGRGWVLRIYTGGFVAPELRHTRGHIIEIDQDEDVVISLDEPYGPQSAYVPLAAMAALTAAFTAWKTAYGPTTAKATEKPNTEGESE